MKLPAEQLFRGTDPSLLVRRGGDGKVSALECLHPRVAEALDAARESKAHAFVVAATGSGALDLIEAHLLAASGEEGSVEEIGWIRDFGHPREARLLRLPSLPENDWGQEIAALRREVMAAIRGLIEDLAELDRGSDLAIDGLVDRARDRARRHAAYREAARVLVREVVERPRESWSEAPALRRWAEELADVLPEEVARPQEGHDLPGGLWSGPWWWPLARNRRSVVREDHPTWGRVFGRWRMRMEASRVETLEGLVPGALHHALGGILIVDADRLVAAGLGGTLRKVLSQGELRAEDGEGGRDVRPLPAPLPLDSTRLVLIGSSRALRILRTTDLDRRLVSIVVELESQRDRDADAEQVVAEWIRELAAPLRVDDEAVAALVEEASRRSGDARRLQLDAASLGEILAEAGRRTPEPGRADIESAIDRWNDRLEGLRRRQLRQIEQEIVRVETAGAQVGQCNALVVLRSLAGSFGRAARVTARARAGKGDVVAIEREAKLSGSVHSKGILVLTSLLTGRYTSKSISLSASVVFEQNYGSIDGDSASLAELISLLSAITDVPVHQGRAMTGSIDQRGLVQAVGGINAKIEGFFELCESRGLDGEQGVVIPAVNAPQLMLRPEVRAAVAEDRFHVWTVETVDEAVQLVTGREAGQQADDGTWSEGSFNRLVADRLAPPRPQPARRATDQPKTPPASPSSKGGDGG